MIIPRIHTKPRTRQGLMWLLVGVLLMTSAPPVRAKGTTAARASAGGLRLQAGLLAPLPVPAGPAPAARAQANTAQDANQDYNSSAGPSYVLPGWGNVPWAAPQYYTTIQLGDLDGDGKDELIGREGDGITVHKFDPVRGQWQPVLAADGTILRGPLPDKDGWDQPQYYLTIQLADVDGKPGKELVGRSAGGMLVYRFTSATPKPGSTLPAGAWQPLTSSGPFADSGGWSGDPSYYTTIRLGDIDGQPGAELIGRGGDGLAVYKWDGMGWTPLTGLPDLNNPNHFTQESYYKTIQLADVDGQPGEELLFRGVGGMRTYKYQHGANGGSWIHLTRGSQPFGDSGYGFDSPSKYWTIQTADIDRDGVPELLGRGQYGVEVFKYASISPTAGHWTGLSYEGPFTDANGWTAAQYYKTIQLADINGDQQAELLGRAGDGMHAYEWDAGAKTWKEISSASAVPALADDPWAKGEQYYTTIQTGNVDGDAKGQPELLARGPTGMRTWFWRNNTWTRDQPYGSFPIFSGDQAAAFTALNKFLGIVNGTIRDVYTDPARDLNSDDLGNYQSTITKLCSGETTGAPPQFQSCTPPSGSGVSAAAWTAVSNQIIAELYWARLVIDHFGTLDTIANKLFLTQNSSFPSIVADIQLSQAGDKSAAANYFNLILNLLSNVLKLVGSLSGPEGAGLTITGNALSTAMSGGAVFATNNGGNFQHTYADMQKQIATIQQQTQTAIGAQKHHVTGDYGLLRTVGELVGSQVWTLDVNGVLSASRYGFTQWVYQAFLPLLWDKWEITGCKHSRNGTILCDPPANGPYIQSYTDGGANFTGLFPKQTPCTYYDDNSGGYVRCSYRLPEQTLADVVWKPVSSQCAYTPGTTNAWVYGQCTLGVDSEVFNNTGGWKFTTRTGDPVDKSSLTASGGRCNTLCFRAPEYYLGRLDQLPRGAVAIAGNGINHSVSTDHRSEMQLALDGGNSAQDRFNRHFVAAQLGLLAAPGADQGALASRLDCYGLDFDPVRLSSGDTLSPAATLGDLLGQARQAARGGTTADLGVLANLLQLLTGDDPAGRCGVGGKLAFGPAKRQALADLGRIVTPGNTPYPDLGALEDDLPEPKGK